MPRENLAGLPEPEPHTLRPHLLRVDEDRAFDDQLTWWGRPLAETRWMLELMRLVVDPVFLGRGVTRGDGRPVNLDCSDRATDRVERLLDAAYRRHERRVALIGHSRGAHYARALAARSSEKVSHVISLGADLRTMLQVSVPTKYAVAGLRRGLSATRRARTPDCLTLRDRCPFMRGYVEPFRTDRVRFTSVYSKGDGVVRWRASVVPDATCVEVTGSHVGLVFNRAVYRVVAGALAQPELFEEATR